MANVDRDKCIAIDSEFNNRKVPFIITSCDSQLNAELYNAHRPEQVEKIKRLAEDPSITKIMFPYTVDAHTLKNVGIRCRGPWEDPLIAGTLLDENFASRKGLKPMAQRYLGADIKEKKALAPYIRKAKKKCKEEGTEFDYSMLPRFKVKPYAIEDAVFTIKLWYLFRDPIKKFDSIYQFEKKLVPIILKMQETGMMVDRKFVRAQAKQYGEDIIETQAKLVGYLKKHRVKWESKTGEFKCNSPKLLGDCCKQLGIELPVNDNGNLITDAKALSLHDEHPFISLVLLDRFYRKQKGTYFDPLHKRHTTADDPYARFFLFSSGARTGRTSAELIQTIPRPDESRTAKAPKIARRAFIPRPGYNFIAIDYKALQMMIFFHYANAKKLIKKVIDGWDPHDAACEMLFGIVEKELRKDTKNIQFGLVFGMGGWKLINMLQRSKARKKTSRLEAEQILHRYYANVPVKEYSKKCVSQLYRTGVLKLEFDSPLMSFHREYKVPHEFAYKGPNVLIQGTEAYVVKSAMIRCDEKIRTSGMDAHMLMNVHDELLFEVNKKEPLPLVVNELVKAMEDHVTFKVPLRVEAKVSDKSWGEVKEWKDVKHLYERRKVHVV
jgi:DNA polymerase-1